ncbi:metal ABC transporter permease [Ketobacter nezhaii]|uniref:metal ABC transporter permease n=1 Tax=Ketobacter sp. MCCC 1A13808 TaxID=2602738 RepID=UPI0018DDA1CC|nr:metal ABC transporter permease [Ketobacter sp. MCCC 1A13808]
MNLSDWTFLMPVFLAGIVVVLSHVPLGQEVVKRGIIFIDLAIAQIAGVGVIAARLLDVDSAWGTQLFAAGAALIGALILVFTERKLGRYQEPLIGILFVLAASLGLLLLSHDPHGGEALKEMLSGQILWVTWQQVAVSSAVLMSISVVWMLFRKRLGHAGFYLLFALTVTTSVQLVGVYLVFASLVIPALAMRNVAERKWRAGLYWGWGIGILGYGAGLTLSYHFDIATSPLIVWALAVCALAGFFISSNSARFPTKK